MQFCCFSLSLREKFLEHKYQQHQREFEVVSPDKKLLLEYTVLLQPFAKYAHSPHGGRRCSGKIPK